MRQNRPELAVLRGKRNEDALQLWTATFAGSDAEKSRAYVEALALFLGHPGRENEPGWERYVGTLSPNTRKAYTFALTEFFEWVSRKHGHVVPPQKVSTFDAEQYVQWLATRKGHDGLEAEKLRDGDQADRLAIYEAVKSLGTCGIRDIGAKLPPGVSGRHQTETADHKKTLDLHWLNLQLGRMVLHRTLVRSPRMSDLRKDNPRLGIDEFHIGVPQNGKTVLMDLKEVFQYRLPESHGAARTTISARVSALSSFWDVLSNTQAGGASLVPSNIWYAIKKRVTRHIADERKSAAEKQRIDPHLVPILLRAADHAKTLPEYRDKAMVYLMVFLGLRVTEVTQLRRGTPSASEQHSWPGWVDLACEPPVIVVTRKGGKKVRLPYPPIALKHLYEFRSELEKASARPEAQSERPKDPNYLNADSPAWRYRELCIMPDAPLFPPLWLWGSNSTHGYQPMRPNPSNTRGPFDHRKPLSRQSVTVILQRLARDAYVAQDDGTRAGLTPEQQRQFHPHALRHFALTAMVKKGKDLREVQAIAGHSSVTTTEQYLEEVGETVALSGQTQVLEYLSEFAPVEVCEAPKPVVEAEPEREEYPKAPKPEAPQVPKRRVIETTAIPVPERRVAAKDLPKFPKLAPEEQPLKAAERPARAAKPKEISSQLDLSYLAPEAALPDNDLPVAPVFEELPVKAVQTGSGKAIEVGGQVVSLDGSKPTEGSDPEDVQMVDGKSAGLPDFVYAAMQDAQLAFRAIADARKVNDFPAESTAKADLKATKRERVASTRLWKKEAGRPGKVVEIQTHERKGTGGKKEKIQVPMVQRNEGRAGEWLLKHYDPWPSNYGIGIASLLPWFTHGNADVHGYVKLGELSQVPPIPVLSPDQASPETAGGAQLLDFIEMLYDSWLNGDPATGIPPSPSRTFGLLRWFGFFTYTAWQLQRYIEDQGVGVKWQPYNAVCTIGEHLRQHRSDWVEQWLRANAHTYTTTRRAFEKVPRGKGLVQDILFYNAFERASLEGVDAATTIPAWFTQDDPIKDLDPVDYDNFIKWIANVTGQRLSKARKEERKTQQRRSAHAQEITEDGLRDQLKLYYEDVDARMKLLAPGRATKEAKEEAAQYKWTIAQYEATFEQAGMPSPQAEEYMSIHSRSDRIEALLKAWHEAHPEAEATEPNLFKGSALFDPEAFRLAPSQHTISHTKEFKAQFQEQYGQDSELVMRRAARGMWEAHKTLQPDVLKPPKEGHHEYLYSVMLSYMAWIVPSPDDMEQRMRDAGYAAMPPGAVRRKWLERQMEAVRDMVKARTEGETEYEVESTAVATLMREHKMDEASAREAVHQAAFAMQQFTEVEEEPQTALIGAEGWAEQFQVTAPTAAEQAKTEWEEREAEVLGEMRERKVIPRRRKGAAASEEPQKTTLIGSPPELPGPGVVIRRKKLKPNCILSITSLPGENVQRFYRMNYDPESKHRVYVSPGALQRTTRYMANARRALPSPFAIIRAINLR